MKRFYTDLHVHIGRSLEGRLIKMATSRDLTLEGIAREASCRKGIEVIGLVDCVSPYILDDISGLLDKGVLTEKKGGGLEYGGSRTLILGAEMETHEIKGCSAHSLCFFPTFERMKLFSKEMSKHVRDLRTCAYMSRLSAQELFDITESLCGIFIPAHVFTPFKSFYGSCCDSLCQVFREASFERIPAVELGLSSDTAMAGCLSELDGKAFLSDSDAHSPAKMGREYNVLEMENASYEELEKALYGREGRKIAANYGLNPLLGKYHRTYCLVCGKVIEGPPPVFKCPVSNKHSVVMGVKDRLEVIKDRERPVPDNRPPYNYRIPLQFIPKVGPKTIDRLIERFGSEMCVLDSASKEELEEVVSSEIANNIILVREGKVSVSAGGGGVYGALSAEKD